MGEKHCTICHDRLTHVIVLQKIMKESELVLAIFSGFPGPSKLKIYSERETQVGQIEKVGHVDGV